VVIAVVRFLFLLAVGLWVGEIITFSFLAAPAIFAVLEPARAGEVVSAIFPRYYAVGTVAAATAVACAVVLGRHAARSGRWTVAVLCLAVGLGATLWAATVVHPRAQRLRVSLQARGEAPADSPEFRQAHRLAVLLNATALLAGVAGLGLAAAALPE
jgi:uncharacterized membrane protein